jgi:hypothetical protein
LVKQSTKLQFGKFERRATPSIMKGFEVLENVIVIEKWNFEW